MMSLSAETIVVFALMIPAIGAMVIELCDQRPNLREAVTLITAGFLFGLLVMLTPEVMSGARPTVTLAMPIPGIPLQLVVEPLGLLFALIASFLWIVTSIYSIGYMRGHGEQNQTRFYKYFAIAIASTMGVAFAGNLFTLFIFYEVLTLSTYPLVTHSGTEEAKRGGRVYLGILLFTSMALLLPAMIWTWQLTGSTQFTPGGILSGKASGTIICILLILYVFGIGKAALMPFHRWLPAAMVAPVPVSALLHAVAVVKAGVFAVVKVLVYIFGLDFLQEATTSDWLVYVSGATIVIASLIALRSDNLKRRLAYSTISQLSYVIMAAAIFVPLSVVGAALHIAAHALGKITLFFAAGSIYVASHKTQVSQLNGIGRRMPWTMGAFAVGSLSMIGLPPTAGFVSKWYIVLGAVEAEHWFAIGVIVLSTLLNAAYFLPIVYAAFLRPLDGASTPDHRQQGEAPLPIVAALMISALLTVLLFLFPGPALEVAHLLVGKS